MLQLAPTPRSTVSREGSARLLRFGSGDGAPVLLVPSLLHRWYVLDLRPGASLVEALVDAGFDVYCFDWGSPGDEDRHSSWEHIVSRLQRALRQVCRIAGMERVHLLGYSMGGTLAAIVSALDSGRVATLVNLAGPIDFRDAGILGHFVHSSWCDTDALGAAGNITGQQLQIGFASRRPTLQLAKWVELVDAFRRPESLATFVHLEAWAHDTVAVPGLAFSQYIRELYQQNALVLGRHSVAGRPVDLQNIHCPILHIIASRDTVCPPHATTALGDRSGSDDVSTLTIPGAHVQALVGPKARTHFYAPLVTWFRSKTCN